MRLLSGFGQEEGQISSQSLDVSLCNIANRWMLRTLAKPDSSNLVLEHDLY
jgi:hypothetical protein